MTEDELDKYGDECEASFNKILELIRARPVPKFLEWWEVQNTGFTSTSWFTVESTRNTPICFKSEAEAVDYIKSKLVNRPDPNKYFIEDWRFVHVTLERDVEHGYNKEVKTKIFKEFKG